jgi:phosphatidylethanolamine/phosphatidyl-N-methylethanolamine N-methyltransferase
MYGLLVFWRELARNPRQVGALIPSSRSLGTAIANEVRKQAPGHVLELGAGTGSVTRALMEISHCMAGYSIIEKSPHLARKLSARYPHLRIQTGCASEVSTIAFPEDQPLTIVSSLPFRSMRSTEITLITNALKQLMARKGGFRLIQYSYLPSQPFSCNNDAYEWSWKRTVLLNMPPAMVWALNKTTTTTTNN